MAETKNYKDSLEKLQKGKVYEITEIQDFVSKQMVFTEDDMMPYTTTRKTNYPKWKHNLQSVLHGYKQKNMAIHDEANNTYIFL